MQTRSLSTGEELNRMGYIRSWTTTGQRKGMNDWCLAWPGWISKELCWPRKAKTKRLHHVIPFVWRSWNVSIAEIEDSSLCGFRAEGGVGVGEKWGNIGGPLWLRMFWVVTTSVSVSWLWRLTTGFQDVIIGENWVLETELPPLKFLRKPPCVLEFIWVGNPNGTLWRQGLDKSHGG